MNTKIFSIALAATILVGGLAAAEPSKTNAVNSTDIYAMRMDRCPYYPSPVVCHDMLKAHAASLTSPVAVPRTFHAAGDVVRSKLM